MLTNISVEEDEIKSQSTESPTENSTPCDNSTLCLPADNFELNFYAYLSESADVRDFKKRIGVLVGKFDCTDFAYVRMENHVDFGKDALVTSPKEQIDDYRAEKLYENDLALKYVMESDNPTFWSFIYDYISDAPYTIDLFRQNKAIHEINQRHGFFDYFSVPMWSCDKKNRAFFAVASRGVNAYEFRKNFSFLKTSIKLLATAVDYIVVTKYSDFFLLNRDEGEPIHINPKPLRVLDMMANNDLTRQQVADQLNIKVETVDAHIATFKRALDVKTVSGAIRIALEKKLISFR